MNINVFVQTDKYDPDIIEALFDIPDEDKQPIFLTKTIDMFELLHQLRYFITNHMIKENFKIPIGYSEHELGLYFIYIYRPK